jgi:hypothetical protein
MQFCGRCGAPVGFGATFCGRCGNPLAAPPPPVAMGYSYPVVGSAGVPGARRKLGHARLLLVAGSAIAILVIVLTVVLVAARPTTKACHFACGPLTGNRLLSTTAYTSSQFHYRVEYSSDLLQVAQQDATSVTLNAASGDGAVVFIGSRGGDVSGAIQNAVSGLDSSIFQNLQQVGSIPGAQVGFVQGQGVALAGQFVDPNGGQATPITVMVVAATQNNLTITALGFGSQDNSSPATNPFELNGASAQAFDFALTNTIWPGS